jgi:hypothetical protein
MSTHFTINFRREAYQRELARVRRRVTALGIWVSYFGVVAVITGLFVLNGMALQRRVRDLESRIKQSESARATLQPWDLPAAEMQRVETFVRNPRQWHTRLARLAALTPPNVAVTAVEVNANNLPGHEHDNDLVIIGTLRPRLGEDRMQGIMSFVAALHGDRGFATGYSTVKLTQSQAEGGPNADASFTIECR